LNTLKSLREAIKQQHRGLLTLAAQGQHASSQVRKSSDSLLECGFQGINHPPYSPDLAPSDFSVQMSEETFCVEVNFQVTHIQEDV